MYSKKVNYVHVPQFDELKPANVIIAMNLEKTESAIYKRILQFCPEIKYRNKPKDRGFFFNILNTLKEGIVDKLVYNAIKNR